MLLASIVIFALVTGIMVMLGSQLSGPAQSGHRPCNRRGRRSLDDPGSASQPRLARARKKARQFRAVGP